MDTRPGARRGHVMRRCATRTCSDAPSAEAAQLGTPGWTLTHPGPEHAIEGFADRVSVAPGESFRLFVSTTAAGYVVTAFRIGAYEGADARAVWTSPREPGAVQAPPVVQAPTSTVMAPWQRSLTVDTTGWPPGDYLLRLDGENGAQRLVPITVRILSNEGRVVVINAVTTWQAYNRWGGYSLYKAQTVAARTGPGRCRSTARTRPGCRAPASSCSSSWAFCAWPSGPGFRWVTRPTSICSPVKR